MSDERHYFDYPGWGGLAAVLSLGLAFPLSLLIDHWRVGGDYFGVVVLANAPLLGLLWGLPVWALTRRRWSRPAYGWLCTHLCMASLNGLCWGYLYAGKLFR